MTRASSPHQKRTWLEVLGVSLCGMGLCLTLAFVGVGISQEQVAKEKQRVVAQMDEMKSALTAAKFPEEQIPGLLRIHKAALVSEATHEHFIILSFLILFSLLVSSLGLTVMLWAKLRTILSPNQPLQATAATPRS